MSVIEERPLRADARRNRAAILKAARYVFGRDGREAQIDDVARRAKVGVGTLYRHFPTKEALLAALAEHRFEQMAELAQDALEVEDPWGALTGFLERAAHMQASDRALSQVLHEQPGLMGSAACARGDLFPAITALIERAQAAGVVREDARPQDVPMLLCALSRSGTGPPGSSWRRLLALLLDGLRPEGSRTPLPE